MVYNKSIRDKKKPMKIKIEVIDDCRGRVTSAKTVINIDKALCNKPDWDKEVKELINKI